ncbi:MAG: hypothetical protein WBF90_10140 [Rivularia sp. (in: cyanobacteria)]
MGHGAWGIAHVVRSQELGVVGAGKLVDVSQLAKSPMPYAQSPMPNPQFPMPIFIFPQNL